MAPLTFAQQRKKQETTKALIEINKINKKYRKEEHQFQVSVVQYLRLKDYVVFAIPNGGSRNAIEGANLKKEGVLAGVADLEILLPEGRHLFLELKTNKGKQRQSQKDFEGICEELGHIYRVVRSIEDVESILNEINIPAKTSKSYRICKICHTPTPTDELDKNGVCGFCS